jgi:16S rRNA (guanine527-N7)-methyltransferase
MLNMPESPSASLLQALIAQHLELPTDQVDRLQEYCTQLWDWNAKLNLTRHTDYDTFVSRDIVDSLELAKLLRPGEEILDVGSGGGVPGIPLAILRPDLHVALSESVAKKAQALKAIVDALQLPIAVHACRAEEVIDQFRFDSLVARAVGPLEKMLPWLAPHWLSIGRLLAVKGPRWTEEVAEATRLRRLKDLDVHCISRYVMQGSGAESVILEIRPRTEPRAAIPLDVSG